MRRQYSWLPFVLVCLALLGVRPAMAAELPDFTKLVEDVGPSVVNISTVRKADANFGSPLEGHPGAEQIPEFFRHFFGDQFGPYGGQPTQSMGSGFIISPDGYILTNNHVVEGADEVIIRLLDRRELTAEVVGVDTKTDLALLKVEGQDLPVAPIGNSENLKVGEWVIAIGSPFGFDYTVTSGIVSAKGRSLPSENYVPFIQTDVAINPGNSGGPLFNLDGKVVGINSQIYTRSGGFMGVSFAIPIDVAMDVVSQLKEKGYVSRGWLGVLIQEVNKDLAESFGLKKPHGALIAQVMPNSPAMDAGLQPGDIITRYNGKEIGRSTELPHLVGRTKPGEKAKLNVVRQGKERTFTITIGTLPDEEARPKAKEAEEPVKADNPLNIKVRNLNDAEKERFKVSGGVLVTEVFEGPAMDAGVRSGDVISSINNQSISSVKEFNKIVKGLPKEKSFPLLIVRQGNPAFIVIRLK